MVASHLLKYCDYHRDVMGYKMDLRYVRDDRGRECDFIVLKNNKPLFAVECKLSDCNWSSFLDLVKEKLKIPKVYLVFMDGANNKAKERVLTPETQVLSFSEFCRIQELV